MASYMRAEAVPGRVRRPRKTGTAKPSLTVKNSAILGVIWSGVFGWTALASYLLASQLFVLALTGLSVGFVLTVVELWWAYSLAKLRTSGDLQMGMAMAAPAIREEVSPSISGPEGDAPDSGADR